MSLSTRMKQLECEKISLEELLEEQEESKKNVEKQVSTLQCQVSPPCRPLAALTRGVEILQHGVPPWFMCKSSLLSGAHLGFASLSSCVSLQLADLKKKLEQEAQSLQSSDDGRKRLQRELESTRLQLEEKEAAYDKLDKTKTRQQQELEDLTLDQDNSRQCILSLEKKQRKFDQVSTVLPQLQLTF